MRKRRFSEAQIIGILKEADAGGTVADLFHVAALAAALTAVAFALTPTSVQACSCAEPGPSMVDQLESEDVAFIAIVVEALSAGRDRPDAASAPASGRY